MASRGEASRIQQMQRGEASRLDQMRAGETSRLQGLKAGEAGRIDQMQRQDRGRIQQMQLGEQGRIQQMQLGEQSRLNQLQASGGFQVDMLGRKGQQYVQDMERNRIESMYGLSAQNATASGQALDTANANTSSALGNVGTELMSAYSGGLFNKKQEEGNDNSPNGPYQDQ